MAHQEALDLRYASAADAVGRTTLALSRLDPARNRWNAVPFLQLADADGAEVFLAPSGTATSPTTWPAGRYRLTLEYRRNFGDEAGPGAHRFDRPVQTRLGSDTPDRATIDWTA